MFAEWRFLEDLKALLRTARYIFCNICRSYGVCLFYFGFYKHFAPMELLGSFT